MDQKKSPKPGPASLPRFHSRVIRQKALAPGLYELQLERSGLTFTAGDEILLHGDEPDLDRTYSIACGENASTLRLLYRLIQNGARTPQLAELKTGMQIDFTGPTGNFHLKSPDSPCIFIATGTGIAPAISFLETYPQLDMTILHGVRNTEDLVYDDWLRGTTYLPCVSGSKTQEYYSGRVTQYIRERPLKSGLDIYLCGSNSMIEDVRALLLNQSHDGSRIFCEPYFFW